MVTAVIAAMISTVAILGVLGIPPKRSWLPWSLGAAALVLSAGLMGARAALTGGERSAERRLICESSAVVLGALTFAFFTMGLMWMECDPGVQSCGLIQ